MLNVIVISVILRDWIQFSLGLGSSARTTARSSSPVLFKSGLRNQESRHFTSNQAGEWQNAYSESFNSRFRDELQDREVLTTLAEAKVLVASYRRHYNTERLHSSLEYQSPAAFVVAQNQTMNSVIQARL